MAILSQYIRTSPELLKTFGPRAGVHAEVYEGPQPEVFLVRLLDGRHHWPAVLVKDVFISKGTDADGTEWLRLGQVVNYSSQHRDVVSNEAVFKLVTFERFERLIAAAARH